MFRDERINLELGKIYRNVIIFSTLIATLFGTMRGIAYSTFFDFSYAFPYFFIMACPEFIVAIAGILIIAGGAFTLFMKKDERLTMLKCKYYTVCSWVFLCAYILSLGIYINVYTLINDNTTQPLERIAESAYFYIVFIALIYLIYHFKTKEVCFNYSIIDLPVSKYYRKVFINVLKLFVTLCPSFALGCSLYSYYSKELASKIFTFNTKFISFIQAYTIIFFIIIGIYLVISFIEKKVYDGPNDDISQNKGITWLFTITTLFYPIYRGFSRFVSWYIVHGGDYSYTKEYFTERALLSLFSTILGAVYAIFAVYCLCCIINVYRNSKIVKYSGMTVIVSICISRLINIGNPFLFVSLEEFGVDPSVSSPAYAALIKITGTVSIIQMAAVLVVLYYICMRLKSNIFTYLSFGIYGCFFLLCALRYFTDIAANIPTDIVKWAVLITGTIGVLYKKRCSVSKDNTEKNA